MRLVCGVGVMDIKGGSQIIVNGVVKKCPIYSRWVIMLRRCYNPNRTQYFENSYKDVTVCDEWLTYSNFKGWVLNQEWVGKDLDKDLISPSSREYSPKTCCFITHKLNLALSAEKSSKGDSLIGCYWRTDRNKFQANISLGDKVKYLGRFDTELEAHLVYLIARIKYLKTFRDELSGDLLKGLNKYIKNFKKQYKKIYKKRLK